MMQATMLPFPYALSCSPFVDLSTVDSVTGSSPSPPVISRCYDAMLLTTRSTPPTTFCNTFSQPFSGQKIYPPYKSSSAKNFSIEAILGLNTCRSPSKRNDEACPPSLRPARGAESRRQERATPYPMPYKNEARVDDAKSKPHQSNVSSVGGRTAASPATTTPSVSVRSSKSAPIPGSTSHKTKRIRTIFTPEQLERLESEFEKQQYMVGPSRLYLASSLHLSEAQVKVWFQNRRIKWRKQNFEMQQARLAQIREADNGESETEPEPPALTQELSRNHYEELLDE